MPPKREFTPTREHRQIRARLRKIAEHRERAPDRWTRDRLEKVITVIRNRYGD